MTDLLWIHELMKVLLHVHVCGTTHINLAAPLCFSYMTGSVSVWQQPAQSELMVTPAGRPQSCAEVIHL